MKYLSALNKRGLSIENLPKTLQKKIQELNSQIEALKEVESLGTDDLKDTELDDIQIVRTNIAELDKHIEHKINIFDPVKYEEKLAKISLMTKVKKDMKEGGEFKEPKVEKVVKVKQEPKQIQVEAPKPATIQPKVHAVPPLPAPHPMYEQEEEFERVAEGKPKKMTTGLILMGVGAFFLTWGAVNFFKSRR